MSLVWSVRDELKTPSIVTSNQIYIRFIGDRSINERDFGKIVKDREKEMKEYADHIKRARQDDANGQQHHQMAIAFNNHFAGFGPQSANEFLRLMNKPRVDWKGASQQKQQQQSSSAYPDSRTHQHHQQQQQTSISDFTHY